MKITQFHPVFLLFCTLLGLHSSLPAQSSFQSPSQPRRPFPQHTRYAAGAILPDNHSRAALDDSTRSFYMQWKKKFVRPACTAGDFYIWFEGIRTGAKQCVSEGQGYGMLITTLMAGFDPLAQKTFDGLYRYYKAHPSKRSPWLMAWAQKHNCVNVDGSSATDGDLDIAYALLLADAQWGSSNKDAIDYRSAALHMIDAIRQQELNQQTYAVLLGNSVEYDSKDYFDSRTSDFMPDHFRAFKNLTKDSAWDHALDNNYRLFKFLQDTYSPEAGLVPDFLQKIHIGANANTSANAKTASISAIPAKPRYLETRYDGVYYYNACRVPWRIASDFLLHGDPRAAAFLGRINHWLRATTKDNPDNISAGYTLSGEDLPKHYFEALSFITPFTVSAMTGKQNQPWLNACYDYLVRFKLQDFDYYDNSIKMIGLIILSGNYWSPE